MKALIIGATGATGKDLVQLLLQDPDYTEVVVLVRRTGGIVHPKLTELIVDFDNLESVSGSIRGDVWFSCLGTTLKAAGSKKKQWHIDYEIPAQFAEIAKKNGIPRAVLVSAYGASATSNIFYSKMKGQLEEHIASLAFDQYIIFKPGMLLRKDTDRSSERVIAGVLRVLNGIGILRKHRPLPTSLLAEKLAQAPKTLSPGLHIIELDKIFD
ncbi:NAD(P)H-binding protein [Dyadobacter sp. CY261]|uniref:NAD(P)H-binding protein n=1 Tax=Dyadobacter sp. CY261 TaxID=2907203 RepID=UPI001F240654|nr:NAD(P)H-binding protein [Dyadobacter sp. CY261]MCF0069536.1 NAD(P)H-binding protein [Dyadobacter sp. CY261]